MVQDTKFTFQSPESGVLTPSTSTAFSKCHFEKRLRAKLLLPTSYEHGPSTFGFSIAISV